MWLIQFNRKYFNTCSHLINSKMKTNELLTYPKLRQLVWNNRNPINPRYHTVKLSQQKRRMCRLLWAITHLLGFMISISQLLPFSALNMLMLHNVFVEVTFKKLPCSIANHIGYNYETKQVCLCCWYSLRRQNSAYPQAWTLYKTPETVLWYLAPKQKQKIL